MAKTTEISIEEKLRQLFALQRIDTKIDEICRADPFESGKYGG